MGMGTGAANRYLIFDLGRLDFRLECHQRERGREHYDTVSDIAEHHSEQKGKRYYCPRGRVDFLIGGYPIAVDDVLEKNAYGIEPTV